MAMRDWKKVNVDSGIIWNKHTDYSNLKYQNMKNINAFVYLYNRGAFEGMEDKFVVSTSAIGSPNPADRIDKGFKTKSQALRFARNYMRKN